MPARHARARPHAARVATLPETAPMGRYDMETAVLSA